jgi:PilZ domain
MEYSETFVESQDSRASAERRREERLPVSWAAEIYIPEKTTMFRGRVVNVSPAGCYVQTVAWVRVPPGTEVELVFLLDGRMTRTLAEARFAQSRTGVGLRFLPMEAEIRRRLDAAIANLHAAADLAEEKATVDVSSEAAD